MIRGKKYDLTQRIEEVLKNKASTVAERHLQCRSEHRIICNYPFRLK
jgi:hypothetical protein